jgi:hypothetical protein
MQAELAYHIFKIEAENKEWREAARSEAEEVNSLQSENTKLRELVKDICNNGLDSEIALRIEELDKNK